MDPRPCSNAEAVQRALRMVRNGGVYELGTGDYRGRRIPADALGTSPSDLQRRALAGDDEARSVLADWWEQRSRVDIAEELRALDLPWTPAPDGTLGSDCAGFAISWCYKLPRHRPGFNNGAWATVADDLNCNSAIEDADHHRELFERVTTPFPGALLVYPTIELQGHKFIGHVAIVTSVARCAVWHQDAPDYSLLDVAQCCGPNGRGPAVIATDGAHWNQHDHVWPKPEHRSVMLRALP